MLEKISDKEIDFSDIPLKVDWDNSEIGKFYRPVKELVSLRIDADVLAWFKQLAKNKPYTTAINQALRLFMLAHKRTS